MAGPLYAGQYGPEGMESASGFPVRSASVSVLNTDGSLAVLYTDKLKQAIAPNPTATDANGNLAFFARPGEYALLINGVILPILVPIHPEDPAIGAWEGEQKHPIVDWFQGEGHPYDVGPIVGAGPGDMYRDDLTGNLYQLR